MKKTRSELRDIIVKILYQIILYKEHNIKYEINEVIKEHLEIENEFVSTSVDLIVVKYDELASLINKYLNNWTLERLGKIDQAILLFSVYELIYTDIPKIVAIDEGVELAKKYSDDDVRKMINGVLDKIYHEEINNE